MFRLYLLRALGKGRGPPALTKHQAQVLNFEENVAASWMGRASEVLPEITGEATAQPQLSLAVVPIPPPHLSSGRNDKKKAGQLHFSPGTPV